MHFRTLLIAAMICSPAFSLTALAHFGGHDADDEKLIPSTCIQLADTSRYSNDPAYPQIRELKARCDARKTDKEKPLKRAAPPSAEDEIN